MKQESENKSKYIILNKIIRRVVNLVKTEA